MGNRLIFFVLAILIFSCNGNSDSDYDSSLPTVTANQIPAPAPLIYTVVNTYPHDESAFTQGLELYQGKLYEGTGEYGKSRLRVVDLKTGVAKTDILMQDQSIFGEGITIFKDHLYQLTWKNNKIFVYTLNDLATPVRTIPWSREGWGVTHDGENLITSDGTSKLYFVQPDEASNTMKTIKIITVSDNQGEVQFLNELEYIEGFIYANVWFTNNIIKINPDNGHVVGVMNMAGLLQQYAPGTNVHPDGVLNGIAYDKDAGTLLITGKLWPKLFEIKLN